MRYTPTKLDGVFEIQPDRHTDARGHFSETFRASWFAENISPLPFAQDNQSLSLRKGTVRGLHAQIAPFEQGKLVTCLVGAIYDVAVDARSGSDSFGASTDLVLSADKGNQLWIPPGFLHGYCTLSDNCVVSYKVTNPYSRESSTGVLWNDPDIGIPWPEAADPALLSEQDKTWPLLRNARLFPRGPRSQ